jgi:hypothetical protein
VTNKYVDWLIAKISIDEAYHNHKETAAWAAAAIYLGGILSLAFTARRILDDCCIGKILLTLLIVSIAMLIILFLVWQYNRKGVAEKRIDHYRMYLYDTIAQFAKPEDKVKLEGYINKEKEFLKYEGKPSHWSETIIYVAVAIVTIAAIVLICWT